MEGGEIRDRLRAWREAPGSVAVFTDIDGTLAPIVPTPDMSEVSADLKDLLGRLSERCLLVAGVSGRKTRGRAGPRRARRRRLLRQPRVRDPARRRGRGDARGPPLPGEGAGAGEQRQTGARSPRRVRRGEGHNRLGPLPQRVARGRRALRGVRRGARASGWGSGSRSAAGSSKRARRSGRTRARRCATWSRSTAPRGPCSSGTTPPTSTPSGSW